MTPDQYQVLALQTEDTPSITNESSIDRLIHAVVGLGGESGELLDQVKRHVFYRQPLDHVNVIEECGDLFWYFVLALDASGWGSLDDSLGEIAPLGETKFIDSVELGEQSTQCLSAALWIHSAAGRASACTGNVLFTKTGQEDMDSLIHAVLDVFQGILGMLNAVGATLEDAMAANIAKLRKRYPEGNFTVENAIVRDLSAERAALENGK